MIIGNGVTFDLRSYKYQVPIDKYPSYEVDILDMNRPDTSIRDFYYTHAVIKNDGLYYYDTIYSIIGVDDL